MVHFEIGGIGGDFGDSDCRFQFFVVTLEKTDENNFVFKFWAYTEREEYKGTVPRIIQRGEKYRRIDSVRDHEALVCRFKIQSKVIGAGSISLHGRSIFLGDHCFRSDIKNPYGLVSSEIMYEFETKISIAYMKRYGIIGVVNHCYGGKAKIEDLIKDL